MPDSDHTEPAVASRLAMLTAAEAMIAEAAALARDLQSSDGDDRRE